MSVIRVVLSGHNYIGSEHLLLGLLREGEGVAARVLESLGAEPGNIRTQASPALVSPWSFAVLASIMTAGW